MSWGTRGRSPQSVPHARKYWSSPRSAGQSRTRAERRGRGRNRGRRWRRRKEPSLQPLKDKTKTVYLSYSLFECAVCIPMLFNCRNRVQIETKCINVHVDSRPKSPVLSNGALVFAVRLNSMYSKMEKTSRIHGNWACTKPAFPAYKNQLTGKPSVPFERA